MRETSEKEVLMSKLLIDDYPIQVLPKLATVIGLNEAIILQQLHYWLNSKSAKMIKGKRWIHNTYEEWQGQFPFWSVATVKRTLTSLSKQNLIIKENYNKAGFDKTIWYSIDYDKLEEVTQRLGQNDPTDGSNCTNGLGQNDLTNTIDFPETTTETTSMLAATAQISQVYQQKIKPMDSPQNIDRVQSFLEDGVALEVILYAIEISARDGGHTAGYVVKKLNDWQRRGVKTVEDAKLADEAWKAENSPKSFKRSPSRKEPIPKWLADHEEQERLRQEREAHRYDDVPF